MLQKKSHDTLAMQTPSFKMKSNFDNYLLPVM